MKIYHAISYCKQIITLSVGSFDIHRTKEGEVISWAEFLDKCKECKKHNNVIFKSIKAMDSYQLSLSF